MSRFPQIIDNIILRNPTDIFGRIYIVSAYAGVTNELLEHKKQDSPAYTNFFANRKTIPKRCWPCATACSS